MSTGVCGIINVNNNNIFYITDLSFYFEQKANIVRIGTKLGGNISEYVYDKYSSEIGKESVLFELTDSPLDIHAECLFTLDGCEMYINETRIDEGESLKSRMNRVQNLLEDILKYEHVTQIILEVDYLSGECENECSIKAKEFSDTIVRLYEGCETFIPSIKFNLTL